MESSLLFFSGLAFSVEGGYRDYAKAAIAFERTGSYARGNLHFLQSNAANTADVLLSESVMTITNNGNVGIGLTNPGYKLHVNGTAGKPGGGSWTAASDRRLKRNISPYTEGLAQLLTIQPVKYQYNKKAGTDTEKEYIGVIAQDLKEVAPYMVGTFEKDGVEYFDVDNSAMMYMLINAVKELKAENEAQQKLIEQLQKDLNKLKKGQR